MNTQKARKSLQTRKGFTMMTKKDALQFAIDVVRHVPSDRQSEVVEILQKMVTQLSKPHKTSDEAKAKAKAKRADARSKMLAEVLPVLRVALTGADGFTAKELYNRCADQLPADFTVNRVQYILLHDLADEVVKTEIKNKPNVYTMKG